jgi:hypothetical protein
MTSPSPAPHLDRVVRTTPLGLRPWDVAMDTPAQPGLRVSCRLRGGRTVPAFPTPSGCYAVRSIPGLHAAEFPEDEDGYWYSPPVRVRVTVEIADPLRRYLPEEVDAELPHRGLLTPSCPAPGPDGPVVPLFTAPARPVPPGFAVVRAELELSGGGPASWAELSLVLPDGTRVRGFADGAGRATVLFPWPEPTTPAPDGSAVPLSGQEWPLEASVAYGTAAGRPVADADGAPELCALLAQRPATLGADPAVRLRYGHELVLRSAGRSTLLLDSAP